MANGGIGVGSKDVNTAGTQVQITATAKYYDEIIIQAKTGNTGAIYVGLSDVSSSNYGFYLTAGQIQKIRARDISDLWIDSAANGEGITYMGTMK